MSKKDKISEEQLHTDPFFQSIGNAVDFYKENKLAIQWSAIALVIVIFMGIFINQYRSSQRKRALLAFENAKTAVAYDEFLDNYDGVNYYPVVLLKKGNLLFSEQKYEDALKSYKRVIDEFADHKAADQALLGLGYTYEEMKDFEKARDAFASLIENYKNSPFRNDAKLNLAGCLSRLGDNEKAKQVLDDFLKDSPNSVLAPKAKQLLPEIVRKM